MSKNKELKYRAICPKCRKPYDIRRGEILNGVLMCSDCFKAIPYTTLEIKEDELPMNFR